MKKHRKYRSCFLFPTPSFMIGAGSVFNIAGNYFRFNSPSGAAEADMKAISSDWGVVGDDIKSVIAEMNKKVK